jgi:nitrogen fixation NifU-like protein
MATELIKGKTIDEAMNITNKAVAEALDGLPPIKMHCSVLAEQAIKSALLDYSKKYNVHIEGLDDVDFSDDHHDHIEEE